MIQCTNRMNKTKQIKPNSTQMNSLQKDKESCPRQQIVKFSTKKIN